MNNLIKKLAATFILLAFAGTAAAALPDPGVEIVKGRTALVITDPQNDFLSPKGVTWGVVGESVTKNNTVENIDSLFEAAKANDMPVFISPHYYYPTDHGWQFEGALEALMHTIGMSANLCTESHMRELIEQGFEVAVVSDATAAAIVEEGNGYEAALVNFRFIANTVWTTEEAVGKINE
jgi:nicotinamidase-related amidase